MAQQSPVVRLKYRTKKSYLIARRAASIIVTNPSQWRYLPEWLRSFRRGYLMERQIPWMCYPAIDFLDSTIGNSPLVFEYGSGASTLYWRKKGAQIVSIEHDPDWHAILSKTVGNDDLIDYRLVEPSRLDDSVMTDAADPDHFHSAKSGYDRYDFHDYVTQIDSFPDGFFDVVVVDGRSRTACIKHALPKVKPGGALVLDNSHREWYLKNTLHLLSDFQRHHFIGLIPTVDVMEPTDIFIRKN